VDRLTEALEEAASSPVQAQHEEEASGPELDSEKWKPALRIMLKQKDDAMGLILPRPSREHQRPVVLATSARIWQPQAETIDNFDQCIARHCVVFCFGCGDQWRKPMCDYSLHVVASRQQGLERRLLQPASTAHPRADLPPRKIRVSRYVSSPEPNSHSNMTSDTIAIGYQPSAQAFASPDFARLNRARHQHHDAIAFPNGNTVLVNLLSEGRYARVLQLPAIRQEQNIKAGAEKALMPAADLEVAA
jgi:hypothetical protein